MATAHHGELHGGLDEGEGNRRGWKAPDSTPRAEAAGSSSRTPISKAPPEALSILGGPRAHDHGGPSWEPANGQDARPSRL